MIELLSFLFFTLLCVAGLLLGLMILSSIRWREQSGEGLVQVVVLGDAGRSPRMQYHCLPSSSLGQHCARRYGPVPHRRHQQ